MTIVSSKLYFILLTGQVNTLWNLFNSTPSFRLCNKFPCAVKYFFFLFWDPSSYCFYHLNQPQNSLIQTCNSILICCHSLSWSSCIISWLPSWFLKNTELIMSYTLPKTFCISLWSTEQSPSPCVTFLDLPSLSRYIRYNTHKKHSLGAFVFCDSVHEHWNEINRLILQQ